MPPEGNGSGPGTKHNPPAEGPGQAARDVRSQIADKKIIDQGRQTVDGATTIANAGGADDPRIVVIWLDAGEEPGRVAVGEAPSAAADGNQRLQGSDTWGPIVTKQEVNMIDEGTPLTINYEVWEVVD